MIRTQIYLVSGGLVGDSPMC